MAMCSSSKIVLDGFRVCLDFISKLVDHFKGGFATDWSEFGLLEYGVLIIDRNQHGGWR